MLPQLNGSSGTGRNKAHANAMNYVKNGYIPRMVQDYEDILTFTSRLHGICKMSPLF